MTRLLFQDLPLRGRYQTRSPQSITDRTLCSITFLHYPTYLNAQRENYRFPSPPPQRHDGGSPFKKQISNNIPTISVINTI